MYGMRVNSDVRDYKPFCASVLLSGLSLPHFPFLNLSASAIRVSFVEGFLTGMHPNNLSGFSGYIFESLQI
jgi:hypothetical protein